jgi:hypothetical protein
MFLALLRLLAACRRELKRQGRKRRELRRIPAPAEAAENAEKVPSRSC